MGRQAKETICSFILQLHWSLITRLFIITLIWYCDIKPHTIFIKFIYSQPQKVSQISKPPCWTHHEKYLYNFDPLKPHYYIVKLGFTGVHIIFLISAQKHKLWVLFRTNSGRLFLWVPTIYVLSRNMKNIRIFIWKLSVFGGEIFNIFEQVCFRNANKVKSVKEQMRQTKAIGTINFFKVEGIMGV